MDFNITTGNPAGQTGGCIVLGVFEGGKLSESAKQVDKSSKGYISKLIKRGDISGKINQSLLLQNVPNTKSDRVLLLGCGKEKELDDNKFRTILNNAISQLKNMSAKDATYFLTELSVKARDVEWNIRQAVSSILKALYNFEQLKSKKNTKVPIKKINFSLNSKKEQAAAKGFISETSAISEGVNIARDLGNLPANICTPTYLSKQAQKLGTQFKSIKTTVLNEAQMKKLGMGALLSVSRGSREPAKLITMEYNGGKKGTKPIVLVGKGITFDSGGISIKPSDKMDEMKFDMCGAASILGTMHAVAKLKLPLNIVGVVASSENLPGGEASKPGDVVTTMSGQTVEVLNTDAEGRLVLCDALTFIAKFKPDTVIDVATLTGAIVVSLGSDVAGLFSNNDALANEILKASKYSGDHVWQMPLWDGYQDQLDSNFADIANIGSRWGGSITAACFLSRFAKKYKWAHLDVAGVAWKTGKEKGSTGRPVPLLMQFLLQRCK